MSTDIHNLSEQLNHGLVRIADGQRFTEHIQEARGNVAAAVGALLESLDDAINLGERAGTDVHNIGSHPTKAIQNYGRGTALLKAAAEGSHNPLLEDAISEGYAAIGSLESETGGTLPLAAMEASYATLFEQLYAARETAVRILGHAAAAEDDLGSSIAHAAASREHVQEYIAESIGPQ